MAKPNTISYVTLHHSPHEAYGKNAYYIETGDKAKSNNEPIHPKNMLLTLTVLQEDWDTFSYILDRARANSTTDQLFDRDYNVLKVACQYKKADYVEALINYMMKDDKYMYSVVDAFWVATESQDPKIYSLFFANDRLMTEIKHKWGPLEYVIKECSSSMLEDYLKHFDLFNDRIPLNAAFASTASQTSYIKVEIIAKYIKDNHKLGYKFSDGSDLIHFAVRHRNPYIIKLFHHMDTPVYVDAPVDKDTPLFVALQCPSDEAKKLGAGKWSIDYKLLKTLIQCGANVNHKNHYDTDFLTLLIITHGVIPDKKPEEIKEFNSFIDYLLPLMDLSMFNNPPCSIKHVLVNALSQEEYETADKLVKFGVDITNIREKYESCLGPITDPKANRLIYDWQQHQKQTQSQSQSLRDAQDCDQQKINQALKIIQEQTDLITKLKSQSKKN